MRQHWRLWINRFMAEIVEKPSSKESMLEACFFGFEQPYVATLSIMHALHEKIAAQEIPEQLMLLEHEPVITVTRQHMFKNIKTSEQAIKDGGIALTIADRGGDATFHGPGQLVGYPMIRVGSHDNVSIYIRSLERALLDAVHVLGVGSAMLLPGFTGVWVKSRGENNNIELKKLVAIGVGVKDGVSKHGFAMNIDINWLRYTEHIVPCGLKDRGVVTLKDLFYLESLEMPSYSAIVDAVSESLSQTFSLNLKWRS